jgi:hypothetical protein
MMKNLAETVLIMVATFSAVLLAVAAAASIYSEGV